MIEVARYDVVGSRTPAGERSDEAQGIVRIVERHQVRAEFAFIRADGVAAQLPTIYMTLWAARGRTPQAASFRDLVVALHRDLLTVAEQVLPLPPPDVVVDLLPPEPALFERIAGHDEVRLVVRAFGKHQSTLDIWAHALSTNLRAIQAKVHPSALQHACQ